MNAVADTDFVESRFRRLHGVEKAALEQKLNDWGRWIEERLDFVGYPRLDAVAAALNGAGGGTPGSRELCLDMPDRLWSIHMRVQRLPDHEHAAVLVWYIPTMRMEVPPELSVFEVPTPKDPGSKLYQVHERGHGVVAVETTAEKACEKAISLHRQALRDFGRLWTTEEKASRLSISVDALYQRLHRARLRLLGILPLFVGIDAQSEVK